MINAEKIANHVAKHGSKSVRIHTMPGTPFWLVIQKTPESSPNWRVVLCDPDKTTWRLVSDKVSDEQYNELWIALLKINIENHLKRAVQTLKKTRS